MLLKTKADVIGWIGSLFFIVGCVLLAYRSEWGFVSNVIGNSFYGIQGGMLRLGSLIVLSILLIVGNLIGVWNSQFNWSGW